MTNTQFYVAVILPTVSFLLVFLVATLSNNALGKRMDEMKADLGKRMDEMKTDLGKRMDRIEAKLDSIDTEIRINHDHRLAVLEAQMSEKVS